jgi:hypothetical protein
MEQRESTVLWKKLDTVSMVILAEVNVLWGEMDPVREGNYCHPDR